MTRLQTTLAASLIAALTLPLLPGCDEGGSAGSGGENPKPGSYVHVHFRKQHLGLASDKPTTPMSEGVNMGLATSGELRLINDEFIVLKADGEAGRELWIPRDVILLMDVRAKTE
jgi:hypothetical protein